MLSLFVITFKGLQGRDIVRKQKSRLGEEGKQSVMIDVKSKEHVLLCVPAGFELVGMHCLGQKVMPWAVL